MKFRSPQSLQSISNLIGAKFIGNPEFIIKGINEIHMVEEGDITFVDFEKYYNKALHSKASVIIIDKEVPCPEGKCLIISKQPFHDYNKITQTFRPLEIPLNNQYQKGIGSIIGSSSVIYPGVVIGNHVTIGNDCIIYPNVVIYDHTIIGNHVIIQANTTIGGDAFYYKRTPERYIQMHSCGRVVLSDYVEIGSNCTIDRGVSGDTFIGEGTKIDNLVQIGHDNYIGKNCIIASQCGIAGVTTIEDDVILWGQVGVNKDIVIGKGAIVLGQSGVTKSIAGGKVYSGLPARENRSLLVEQATLSKIAQKERNKKISDD